MSSSQPYPRSIPKSYTELDHLLELAGVPSEEERRYVLLRPKRFVQTIFDRGVSPTLLSRLLFGTLLVLGLLVGLVPHYPELAESMFVTQGTAFFVLLWMLFGGVIGFAFFFEDLWEPTSVKERALDVDETTLTHLPLSWRESIVALQEEAEKVADIHFEVEQWSSLGYAFLVVCDAEGRRRCIDYQEFGKPSPHF